jgi:hypothetical protein
MPRVWFVKLELVVGLVCAFIVSGVRVDSEESHDGLSRSQATAADSPSYFEEHVSSLRLLRDDGGVLARYKRATMTTGMCEHSIKILKFWLQCYLIIHSPTK